MSVTPSIKLVAYEDRQAGFVFVAVPDERGRYLRTDKSVVQVDCPLCKSIKGEPCSGSQGYSGGTHAVRRTLANRLFHGIRGEDQLEPAPAPLPNGIRLIEPRPVGGINA